uniref:Sugar phosphate transporter domain-containing protein n=1 Tax=Polytomella parva TaxID=51329 RepID=A0A7S0YKQ8_9CHLO|mmetsp:Transcript_26380/g.48412  ORF Transcript_26380/g.48412 Transcript_26380/m.48412 type:complete len:366 (+) Transcript_26380:97-1194(+)
MSDSNFVGFQLFVTYGYMTLWIFLSSGIILLNKYILSAAHFPYPVSLTCSHMLFSSIATILIAQLRLTDVVHVSSDIYIRCIIPISVLFATTLWLSNAAYIYLSVSFVQMVKASMPLWVFSFGVVLGVEKFTLRTSSILAVVVLGVGFASFGEVNFVLTGFVLLMGSFLAEAARLNLIQILLQRRGIRLNPISTLYHIAPCCLVILIIPFLYIELPRLYYAPKAEINVPLILCSSVSAFALNVCIFILIGRTSALIMNVAGIFKDWLLIVLSVFIFGAPVTSVQAVGYGVALLGVMYYNYSKIREAYQRAQKASHSALEERGMAREGGGKGGGEVKATISGLSDGIEKRGLEGIDSSMGEGDKNV